ncbi:MAG: metallophosphoesterase [Candidatus Krumholzibacteriia bacterium]
MTCSNGLVLDRPRGRTIVVGDIHGCWDEFATLLDGLGFDAGDLVLCVGDLIDRGPDTWRVARFFRKTPNAHTALGNHERLLACHILENGPAAWSQQHALAQLPREQWEDWARWLLDRPAVIATPDVVVTHARLDPVVPLADQDPIHTCAIGDPNEWIEQDPAGVPLWIRSWQDPRPVCMGHLVYPQVELVPRRLYALDTGCCRGGALTALVLPDFGIVAEPARANHALLSRKAWEAQAPGEPGTGQDGSPAGTP